MNELIEFSLDTENGEKNYALAQWYENQGHTAPAHSYYLRAAERAEDNLLAYSALIRASFCYKSQGSRDATEKVLLENALNFLPKRPEAYYFLSLFHERKGDWQNCYTYANLGLQQEDVKPIIPEFQGNYLLIFQKAVSSWWWGKGNESRSLLKELREEYWDNMDENHRKLTISNLKIMGVDTNSNKKNIIDYFLFFNERELLELRLNLLKDYVDKFIISELNYTHSGKKKEFICKKIVNELGFSDKVKVIEVNLDEDNIIENGIDIYNARESNSSKEVKAWTRERLQRDAILQEVSNYADDTVFILGDCDEIINPEFIDYFSSICKNLEGNIIKIPLVLLEGRSDKRLYEEDNFVPWANSLLMCTAKQLKSGGTPTKMRSNVMNEYSPVWITENNQMIQDCGWHFTWMGNESRRKEKVDSFIHYANIDSVNTLSSDSIKKITNKDNNTKFSKRNYPVDLLPNIIFSLPKVRDFLLPIEEEQTENIFNFSNKPKSTVWIVDNFYENPDEVRKFALEQDYDIGGIGRGYIGNRTHQQFLFPGLKEKFEDIIGQKITKWEEHGMNGRFQYCWSGQPLVYHCDNQKWGGMLYLTPDAPYQCGTTLYAHKQTRARTYYDEGWDAAWTNIPGDPHLDGTPFEPVDVLGNVYNRLVIFDAQCIHSASEYFGTVKENCRLWQMFFFDT